MKKLILIILLFQFFTVKSQKLYSIWIDPVDSAMYVINPLKNDTTQVTKLPKTLYQGTGTGTAYTLTTTPSLLSFGTTSPTVTIAKTGTYRVDWFVRTDYIGATLAVNRTITYKVRKTNGSGLDLMSTNYTTEIVTLLTKGGSDITRFGVWQLTAGDILQLWGSSTSLPTIGSIQTPEASILATRLY